MTSVCSTSQTGTAAIDYFTSRLVNDY